MALKDITLDQFEHMQIDDENGRLFWMGKPIQTRQAVSLEWPTFALALAATAAAWIAAMWPIVLHLKWFGL